MKYKPMKYKPVKQKTLVLPKSGFGCTVPDRLFKEDRLALLKHVYDTPEPIPEPEPEEPDRADVREIEQLAKEAIAKAEAAIPDPPPTPSEPGKKTKKG